ncbi:MAG: hypothetical protein KA712_22990 [Myxococcales bacterium]|nr:hypothetical protein [Myxococcales bacterium]
MDRLIAFLLEHAILDFSGDLNMEMLREFLRGDESPEAHALIAKVSGQGSLDDMIVTLADCLQEYIRTGVNEKLVKEQIKAYAES